MEKFGDFIDFTKYGLYCIPGDFYLDPKRIVQTAVISHAHGDHAVPNNRNVYCTKGTRELMGMRYNASARSNFHIREYGQEFMINDVRISFHAAGHILGSAQILLRYQGERYLYTGDFKLQPDKSCESFEFVECDHLITETTFADPEYNHPEPISEIKRLNDSDQNVVIGAYAVGKAQRITQMLAEHCPHKKVYVHNGVAAFHKVYEEHNRDLGNWYPYRRQDFLDGTNAVYILPPSHFARYSRNRNVKKIFATGWKRPYYSCDDILRISDHADWQDVLTLVKATKTKYVYTVHGDGSYLMDHLKDSGIGIRRLS